MYKDIFFVILQILFVSLVIFFYFSEENITKINKSRSKNYAELHININDIPLLENDTIDIIEYLPESTNDKGKKKYNKFYELIGD